MFVAVLSGSADCPRRVEDVEDVVHGLEHVAVADTQPLVGRLDRELVAAARVALLVGFRPSKPVSNCGFDFAFLPLLTETPLPVPWEMLRLTMVPPNASGPSSSSDSPANSSSVTSGTARRREVARLRRARAADRVTALVPLADVARAS